MVMTSTATPSPVEVLLDKVNELAVLPHVVYKVLEISGTSDSSPIEIERAILVDPGFSGKVLALANSAGFGAPRRVNSIRDAVMLLGFRNVRNLAMTVGTYNLFVGKNDKESLRRRSWWRHSVDTAVLCKWLAARTRAIPYDEAYTSGLLHWIGKTLLDRFGEGSYADVETRLEDGMALIEAEREVYGCDHSQVTRAATAKWGLSPAMQSAVDYLSEPDTDDPGAPYRAVVSLCSALVHGLTQGSHGDQVIDPWVLPIINLVQGDLIWIHDEGLRAVSEAQLSI